LTTNELHIRGDIVGRGLTFPLVVDHSGNLALTRGDDCDAAIRMIIGTAPGERVMRPEFGCKIWDLLFAPINVSTIGQMEHAVRLALSQWEPRIEVDDIRVIVDDDNSARVFIEIDYRVSATNSTRNLVYPFYLIPEEPSA
jgi:phage baseplate assembly protein W